MLDVRPASAAEDPALGIVLVDLAQNAVDVVCDVPAWVVELERLEIADPPAMVADPVGAVEAPCELTPCDLLAQVDRLQHRAVALASAADVVNSSGVRRAVKGRESSHQVSGVDVVAHLLAGIAKHGVGIAGHRAAHQIGEEPVQLRASVIWSCQTAATKADGGDVEVAPILLNQKVSRRL